MVRRPRQIGEADGSDEAPAHPLRDAIRRTRVELAEKSSVVVDLRDAELARLELLDEALDPLFRELPPQVELFDRGISQGDTPRLWLDAVAHVEMGRDKRRYRFVLDTRHGRKVLAESTEIPETVEAIAHYVASRVIERERALLDSEGPLGERLYSSALAMRRRWRWRMLRAFLLGLLIGAVGIFAVLWIVAARLPH